MMPIELSHIGEDLIAEMLRSIAARNQLSQVACARSGVTLDQDIQSANLQGGYTFTAEDASVVVMHAAGKCSCDGEQKVDVLCAGAGNAIAIEAKLGEARMSANEFKKRFCQDCEQSSHSDSRLRGSMIAVLERNLPFQGNVALIAERNQTQYTVAKNWWLVLRKAVLEKWQKANDFPVSESARILTFDALAKAYGSRQQFDQMVQRVVGADFAGRWMIDLSDP